MSPPKPSYISCYNTPLVNPFSLYIFNSLQNLLVKWIHIDFSEPQFLQPLPCIAWCFFRSLSSEKPQWVSILDPVNDDKESFLTHLLGFEHNAGLEFLVVIGLKKNLMHWEEHLLEIDFSACSRESVIMMLSICSC